MKNAKQLARKVAHDNNWPETEVYQLYIFLMSELKKHLSGCRGAVILYRTGSFNVSPRRLRRRILEVIKRIRKYKNPKYRMPENKRKLFVDNYEKSLRDLLAVHNDLAVQAIRLKKHNELKKLRDAARYGANYFGKGKSPYRHKKPGDEMEGKAATP